MFFKSMMGAGVLSVIAALAFCTMQLDAQAQAVVIGSVCGIGASIPVCIALVIGVSGEWRGVRDPQPPQPAPRAQMQIRVLCEHGIDVSRALCFACAEKGRLSFPMRGTAGAPDIKQIGKG